MLKGSMKAVVIYRREWSKSSGGCVAKTPFCKLRQDNLKTQRTLMSISNLTQCCAETSVCWAQSIALLLNGFFSLFGPGNSVAKWLLLETSTWKLWMAATALVIVMNATFVVAADAVPFISTDSVHLTLTFSIDSKVQMLFLWQKLELLRVHCDNPLLCIFASFCAMLNWLYRQNKGPWLLILDGIFSAVHLFSLNRPAKINPNQQLPSESYILHLFWTERCSFLK